MVAHVAAEAGPGEIPITETAAAAAGIPSDGLERRHLSLKGHPMDALVVSTSSPT